MTYPVPPEYYMDDQREDQHVPMECDRTKTLRTEQQLWLEALPASWKNYLRTTDAQTALNVLRYLAKLSLGLDEVLVDLRSVLSNDKAVSSFPHLYDVNDEDFDKHVMKNAKPTVEKIEISGELSIQMQFKMWECMNKKKEIIGLYETIETNNGKPEHVTVENWLRLPPHTRQQIRGMEKDVLIRFLIEVCGTLFKEHQCLQNPPKDMHKLEQDFKRLAQKNIEIQEDRAQLHHERQLLKEQITSMKRVIQNRDEDISRLKRHLQKVARESNPDVVRHLQHNLEKVQTQLTGVVVECTDLKKDKQQLLTRLSEVAGEKLTHNNPAITDLSDEHRPIKLSEKFSQMYDDMWTDALEEFTKHKIDEVVSVQLLLNIVMRAFEFCCDPSIAVDVTTCDEILWFDGQYKRSVMSKTGIKEDERLALLKCVKGMKQRQCSQFLATIEKKFTSILEEMINAFIEKHKPASLLDTSLDSKKATIPPKSFVRGLRERLDENTSQSQHQQSQSLRCAKENEPCAITSKHFLSKSMNDKPVHMKDVTFMQTDTVSKKEGLYLKEFPLTLGFAKNCIELCWRMRLNEPPVELDASIPENRKFNNDIYKAYTRSGSEVEYVVWPAMYLYKDGPLLSKGVAQARPK